MKKTYKFIKYFFCSVITIMFVTTIYVPNLLAADEVPFDITSSEKDDGPVEINGDTVEFEMHGNKVIAKGNVEVIRGEVTLLCDRLEFFRDKNVAYAEGNVVLINADRRVTGDKMKYDFNVMKGDFLDPNITATPFYSKGKTLEKVGDNHFVLRKGYTTTCDYKNLHYRFVSSKIDIYPQNKLVARNVRLVIGKFPIFYIPRFTQDLSGKEPMVIITPGYDKEWGMFLLTKWRYHLTKKIKGYIHLDYRERKDFAWGIDANYDTVKHGDGIVRTYYMHERDLGKKYHFWKDRLKPTPEYERYMIEWRHKWEIDPKTNALLQYFRTSDVDFRKDYFEREYKKDAFPSTYFLLTKVLPVGSISFNTTARVNRIIGGVESLPKITYTISNQEILETGFYIKNVSEFANFVKKSASPNENRKELIRVYNEQDISYPFKVSFIEVVPFAGQYQIFYSRTTNPKIRDIMQGVFYTGADLSTKFYRIYNVHTNKWGININKLRHIFSPSISYRYAQPPTFSAGQIESFDGRDGQSRHHSITFGFSHKLQTKRNKTSVDLFHLTITPNFLLKENPGNSGFQYIKTDVEITPYEWLELNFDSQYNTRTERLETANIEMYINGVDDRWYYKVEDRFVDVGRSNQFVTEFGYKINRKWGLKVYERLDLDSGVLEEQEYSLTRDLHCWDMNINYNITKGYGEEVWFVFKLKAFPKLGFDFGSSFHRRKPGSQYNPADGVE